jgi:hypothetical protein
MATYYRRDEWVQDAMGQGVSGVLVYLCAQPAITSTVPPSPLIKCYSDPEGTQLFKTPPQTDFYGHTAFFAPPGIYTVVYYSTQIATPTQTLVLPDQIISGPTNLAAHNSDSTTYGTIKPAPNGATVAFTLSAAPSPTTSLAVFVNGLLTNAYAYSAPTQTVIFHVAPLASDVISATYQI